MNESEIDLDNLPLAEALSFADEGSTTGGLLTHAALKTLAAGCRELTAARAEISHMVSENGNMYLEIFIARNQRDRLAEALEHTMKHMRHSLNCPARLSEGLHACNCQMEWAYDNATEALQSLNQDHIVDANDMIAAVKGGSDD